MSDATADRPVADPIMARLDDQRNYKCIKLTEIIAAALIPFIVGAHIANAAWVAGGLGVLITILEGVLQLYQYQQIWLAYRATAEAMKHEKFIYMAKAGQYATAADPHALLAERVEALGSQENSKWASMVQLEQRVKAGT